MSKGLKLALLEDSVILLKDLQSHFEENQLGSVVFSSTNSVDFLEKMKSQSSNIDALILDIDLAGDSMSGIDVANCVSDKPILFLTGKTRDYIDQIETLKFKKDVPVEFMTKPLNVEKLINIFSKFEKSIKAFKKTNFLNIKIIDFPYPQVKQEEIVYICSDQNPSTNNKKIQLTTREKEYVISRKSMDYFFEQGLSKDDFIQTSQSYIVNKRYLIDKKITRNDESCEIDFIAGQKSKTHKIEITEEYWRNLKKQ